MNCSECKRESASPEASCPPRMQDGRGFTDYHTRCSQNQFLKARAQMPSSYDYRMFLVRNADALINEDRANVYKDMKCVPCYDVKEDGTMLPEQSTVKCTDRVCNVSAKNPAGLGQGRTHNDGVLGDFVPAKVSGANAFYPIGGKVSEDYDSFGSPI